MKRYRTVKLDTDMEEEDELYLSEDFLEEAEIIEAEEEAQGEEEETSEEELVTLMEE